MRLLWMLLWAGLVGPVQAQSLDDFSDEAEEEATPLVAVLEIRGELPSSQLTLLSDEVRSGILDFTRDMGFVVMSRENMAVLAQDMGLDVDCVEGACEVETGRNLNAAYVVSGHVVHMDKEWICTVKVFDTRKGALLASDRVRAKVPTEFLDGLRGLARGLMETGLSQNPPEEDPAEEDPPEAEPATVAGPATVFVAPFVAKNPEAVGMAGMMPSFLEMELDQHSDLQIIRLEEIPPVHDQDAAAYLDSCPPGQIVGCAFVVAENSGARFALAGTARTIATGTRAEIVIIDVPASREVIAFQVDLGSGDDERFAEGVAGVLVAVVKGEAGRLEDIRDLSETEGPDYSAAISQLNALSSEIGDVSTLQMRRSSKIIRPRMTSEDIADRMETEGVKPWERVGMGPNEYLRFKNSGMSLSEWQNRNSGRSGQLIIRPAVGYGRGTTHGKYYGSYARGGVDTLAVQDVYAWQSQLSGGGLHTSFSLGYGLSRIFELGATVGYAQGRYEIEVLSKTINNTAAPTRPTEHPNPNVFMGGYILASMMPDMAIRPVIGGGATYWKGSGVETKEQLPEDLPRFDGPALILAEARVGAEARLSSKVDAFLHVPVTALVAGSDTAIRHQGGDCLQDDGTACLRTSKEPPGVSGMGAGVMLGIQIKLFGKKFDKVRYREFDVDDGELD